MKAIPVVAAALVVYFLGYRFYARYLARKIFRIDPEAPVPSVTMADGIDYVPTNRYVLFGHHFASIAGAAPIVGPALAVFWGWLPALLWVVFGAVLMGCVHDFSALILSARHKARSIADIAGEIVGKKATAAFMIVTFFVVVLLTAIFLILIAKMFIRYPKVVFPAGALVVIAVGIGLLIYRTKIGLGIASIVGITLMLASIWVGNVVPISLPFSVVSVSFTWIVILAVYAFIASVLPVWLLLQPRDYLESFKLYAGLGLLFAGIMVTNPTIVAPAIRSALPAGTPSIWPFLFVTIACGALTGFHSIVAGGTSSKQLASEKDALFVGYGGMIGESALALCAVIACTAGFTAAGGISGADRWLAHYSSWADAGGIDQKLAVFVDGAAYFFSSLGIPTDLGIVFAALIIVGFALTTLDSACRLGRYIVGEFGDRHRMPILKNRYVGSLVAASLPFMLATWSYGGKAAGLLLWPLFATTNQLLAALVFATVTVYLVKRRTKHWFISIPLIFVAVTTISAMIVNIISYVRDGNWLLVVIGGIILAAGFLLIALSCGAFVRARNDNTAQA